MLTLIRKVGTRVFLRCRDGTEIIVSVENSNLGRAKLGFVAPPEVQIVREEIATPRNSHVHPTLAGIVNAFDGIYRPTKLAALIAAANAVLDAAEHKETT